MAEIRCFFRVFLFARPRCPYAGGLGRVARTAKQDDVLRIERRAAIGKLVAMIAVDAAV